jgi:hypothetical protein
MRTARKIRFDDSYAGMVNDIQRNRFYQNPLIYGLSARLGYGDIFIKCKVALNPMFQQNLINPVPYHAASLTLGIDFL